MYPTKEEAALWIEQLLCYAKENQLMEGYDTIFVRNALLDLLQIDAPYDGSIDPCSLPLPEYPTPLLENLLDYCAGQDLLGDNTLTERDLMDTRIMGLVLCRPSDAIGNFIAMKETKGIEAATDTFYALNQKSDYIRTERIARNIQWASDSPYGTLQITINLTKPEKDPKEIAALKNAPSSGYPKCVLCPENVGYAGRLNHPARQTLRTLPVSLQGEPWHFQYSPYVYYNEHCIVFKEAHVPMKLSQETFARLFDFTDIFPHYFIGSNADLPIVGGSILNHDHFQGGRYVFPMEVAAPEYALGSVCHLDIEAFVIHWPMSVLRLVSPSPQSLTTAADTLLTVWREYSDEAAEILAYTTEPDGSKTPHNTITPIAKKTADGKYVLDLVLRNNRMNQKNPLGIFHPHQDLHHIKKENIGLIEVMGLFILPGRLLQEMKDLTEYLTGIKPYDQAALTHPDHPLAKHALWLDGLIKTHGTHLTENQAEALLHQAVGDKCQRVLEDAGVFKTDAQGRVAFDTFLKTIGWQRI